MQLGRQITSVLRLWDQQQRLDIGCQCDNNNSCANVSPCFTREELNLFLEIFQVSSRTGGRTKRTEKGNQYCIFIAGAAEAMQSLTTKRFLSQKKTIRILFHFNQYAAHHSERRSFDVITVEFKLPFLISQLPRIRF